MLAGVTNTAALGSAESYLLPSVAAAVIGGTSIFGGRGGYAGTIVGAADPDRAGQPADRAQGARAGPQIVYGAIILAVAAAYARVTGER